jgi:hypothetical protein
MALALREKLASNTIAGRETSKAGADVGRELERLATSWVHLGPALDDEARTLSQRFDEACTRLRQRASTGR